MGDLLNGTRAVRTGAKDVPGSPTVAGEIDPGAIWAVGRHTVLAGRVGQSDASGITPSVQPLNVEGGFSGLLLLAVHHVDAIHTGGRIGQFPASGMDHIGPATWLGGGRRRGILQNHHLFGAGGEQKAGREGGKPMAHIFSSDSGGTRLEPHEQRRWVPYNGPFAFQTS